MIHYRIISDECSINCFIYMSAELKRRVICKDKFHKIHNEKHDKKRTK